MSVPCFTRESVGAPDLLPEYPLGLSVNAGIMSYLLMAGGLLAATGPSAVETVASDECPERFPTLRALEAGPWRVRPLGDHDFTFSIYGCPAQIESIRALVETMKSEDLGNGFDPGPAVVLSHRPLYEYLREVGWPVVGYASTPDHQVKEGTCALSEEREAILEILDDAGIFTATQLGEWGYYFHNLSHAEGWWRAVYGESFDEYRHLMKPAGLAGYDLMPESRRECHDILEDYFRTRQRAMRGWNLSVTGHSHYEAYVGQWGARVIGLELGENIAFTQSKIAFARGASRRTGTPWSIQVSPWFHGSCTTNGPLRLRPDGTARGLDAGHSLSFYSRMWLHAWFAGTAMVTAENSIVSFFESESPPWRLTAHGRRASGLFRAMRAHDRGVPYTPVAIVIDRLAGYNGYMAKPWGILEPTQGDLEIRDLLEEQLFPGSDHIHQKPSPENPEASYLRPTPFGEIFDVQLSDAPAGVLASYPVLLLAGDITFDRDFTSRLLEALRRGRRLLLGRRHGESAGRRLAALREAGEVELLEPWTNPATGRPAAIADARLARLAGEVLPVAVRGDPVQFQVNRTRGGWVVELVNHRGVIKHPTTPAVIDESASATVRLTPAFSVERVREWITGSDLARRKPIVVEVPAGGTALVELTEAGDSRR